MSQGNEDVRLRSLWQSQAARPAAGPEPTPTPAVLDAKARRLARRVRYRNMREYLAVMVVVPTFVLMAARSKGAVSSAGYAVTAAASLYVAFLLHRRGSNRPAPPPDAPTREHLAHYRAELVRQRDLLAAAPRWYVAPFMPGLVLAIAGMALEMRARGVPLSAVLLGLAGPVAVIAGIVVFVLVANRRAAAALTREIAALGE